MNRPSVWQRAKQAMHHLRDPDPRTSVISRAREMRVGAALHEAASTGRRLGNWDATSAHINTILASSGDILVRRARELTRTNGYAISAKEEFSTALTGTGVRPSSTIPDEELQKEVTQLWNVWISEVDPEGVVNFYGMQDISSGAQFNAGELFIRLRPRRQADGLAVPLQLQMLPTEMLDRTYDVPLENGHQIRSGIEFDAIGRRAAYWFWKSHPGDYNSFGQTGLRTRVRAENVLHVYEVTEAGQIRGIPRIVPAMIRLWNLDKYDDAELDRKKVAALIAAFITKDIEGSYWTNEEESVNENGLTEAVAEWAPGMVQELLPGEDVKFSEPADVGGQYEAFQMRNLLAASAAAGVSYSGMTGDVSKANYSSLRADQVRFKARSARIRDMTTIFQFCRRVWNAFIDASVISGVLDVSTEMATQLKRKVVWIPPKWAWVDPKKDREAEILAIDNNIKPRSEVVIAEGGDPEDTDIQIAKDEKRERDLGIEKNDKGEPIPSSEEDEKEESQRKSA